MTKISDEIAVLRLSKISKHYEGLRVVDEVDLLIEKGRTYALIGPSGCGKSTLLRMIIGLIPSDAGVVYYNGRRLAELDVRTVRAGFGYVIQSGGLFPHLTARQNVVLPAAYRQWSSQKVNQRLGELRELTQLPKDCLDRYPAQLSGGQRQRVSLMRALVLDPEVLLMDEPLGALDPMIRRQLQVQLRQIFHSLNKTVLMVTHDLSEAAYFADQLILMRGGRVVQQGSLDSFAREPASPFVTAFIDAQKSHLGPAEESQR